MKIAMFSRFPRDLNAPRGGIETVTLALVKELAAKNNVDLHVITLQRDQAELEVRRQASATIHRLPGTRWPLMLDILIGPGKRRLVRYLTQLHPDIVHFHEYYGLGIRRLPMPHVYTMHGFDHANILAERERLAWLRAPIWKRIEAYGLSKKRHMISITPYVRRQIAPLTRAAIYDIDNPIDPRFFDIQRNEVPGRIFYAGWISPRKNALALVNAFAKLTKTGLDAALHLAGEVKDPQYAEQIQRTIAAENLQDRVKLLGRISPEQIRRELSQACVFVLPSRQENSPMAIEEALAAGVPVVSTNRCGMPFMITDARTGYLVDPEDPHALAERIQRILTHDDLRAEMSRTARETALKRFHPKAVADKTLDVYRRIIRGAT